MKLIYFHGFGSSAASGTIRTLRERLPDFEVIAPDIPVDPAEALPFLRELCEKEQPNVVVGTSMGGMYAQQMFGINDTQVNCEKAFFQHYHNIIHFSGGHRLDDITINEILIPLIHLMA